MNTVPIQFRSFRRFDSLVGKVTCLCLFLMVFLLSCESPVVTGEKDVEVISHMTFAITSRSYTSEKLTIIGTVKNEGSQIAYPIWYVEGDFYADDTYQFKFGGDNCKMNYQLAPGETTSWKLEFSSDMYIESDYPNFAVKNLRAFYYEDDD
ncbi:MAG: hypothetical protein PHW79_01905 [Candidatus Marinimicrobia bacterium]|nr:hypothetical protein [Candidatus Neomarinimicrobiota bacterium]